MKKSKLRLVCMILTIIFVISIMPTFVRATDNIEAVILENANGEKIIYIKGMSSTEFKYAFSDDSEATDLMYTTSLKDTNGENVAIIESGETYKYMFLVQQDKTDIIELTSLEVITNKEIEKIETLTKTISVVTDDSTSETSTTEDGTTVMTTTGKIVIQDKGKYQYQLIEILDKNESTKKVNETAVELYNKLTELEKTNTMYEKLMIEITIRDDYNTLIEQADWEDVEEMTILQSQDAQKGEKYIVLIQKIEDGESGINDMQIMTCDRADDADVEYTNKTEIKVVEKKTALPVTGENLALYIVLGVIILAIIILVIRMKYVKGKQNEDK